MIRYRHTYGWQRRRRWKQVSLTHRILTHRIFPPRNGPMLPRFRAAFREQAGWQAK